MGGVEGQMRVLELDEGGGGESILDEQERES